MLAALLCSVPPVGAELLMKKKGRQALLLVKKKGLLLVLTVGRCTLHSNSGSSSPTLTYSRHRKQKASRTDILLLHN